MPDSSADLAVKVARNVLKNTLRVRPGENVTIESWSGALPYSTPFVNEARRLGAHPMFLYEDEPAYWEALESGTSRQTGKVGSHEWAALANTSAYVFFWGPSEWPRAAELPEKQRSGVQAYNPEWYRRAAKAKIRGARVFLGRTSERSAERWGVDLDAWREELLRASLVPPAEMNRLGKRIGARFTRGKAVRITHPNGTDLSFRLGKFPVQLDDALVDAEDVKAGNNMASIPGGVVGVCIDHLSTEGTVYGNHTTYPESGPVTGHQWTFRDGRLTDQSYDSGGEPILSAYGKAPRTGRDRLGFVSIGLNREISKLPMMEDQELGAVLLQLGGNQYRGGKNASPFGAWLLLKDADVTIEGRPVVDAGKVVA